MARTAKPLDLVTVPSNIGPLMAELPEIEQQFVIAMIETGGDQRRSALMAGFAHLSAPEDRGQTASTAGYRLSHRPRVMAAMREQTERMLKAGTIKAAATIIALMDNPDPKVKLKAAERTLDRAGMGVITKHEVEVTDNRTTAELLAFIKQAAREQGLDPRKLLGQAGVNPDIIDAEFSEVLDVVPSTEGLEDIL